MSQHFCNILLHSILRFVYQITEVVQAVVVLDVIGSIAVIFP